MECVFTKCKKIKQQTRKFYLKHNKRLYLEKFSFGAFIHYCHTGGCHKQIWGSGSLCPVFVCNSGRQTKVM